MKYAVVAALFALAAAQTRDDIPKCALPCIDDAIKSGTNCATDDYPCVCAHKGELVGSATKCVSDACGADVAIGKVLPAVNALCEAQGTKTESKTQSKTESMTKSTPSMTESKTESMTESKTESKTESTPSMTKSATTTMAPVTTDVTTTVPCDTTTMVSQTHAGNMTTTTVPVAAGAAGLSAGAAAIALAALAL